MEGSDLVANLEYMEGGVVLLEGTRSLPDADKPLQLRFAETPTVRHRRLVFAAAMLTEPMRLLPVVFVRTTRDGWNTSCPPMVTAANLAKDSIQEVASS